MVHIHPFLHSVLLPLTPLTSHLLPLLYSSSLSLQIFGSLSHISPLSCRLYTPSSPLLGDQTKMSFTCPANIRALSTFPLFFWLYSRWHDQYFSGKNLQSLWHLNGCQGLCGSKCSSCRPSLLLPFLFFVAWTTVREDVLILNTNTQIPGPKCVY